MQDPRSNAGKPTRKQELLGQVFTSMPLAKRMVKELLERQNGTTILDPCVGPFTFPNALMETGDLLSSHELTTVDIDPEMSDMASDWNANSAYLHSLTADYLLIDLDKQFDLAILNPPYIRQEWIEKKLLYQKLFADKYDLRIPGTSNLYVYFIVKVVHDLRVGGHFSVILYDSWQSTKYGQWLISFLDTFCDSITIEAVPNQPFKDRLIDATILYGRKSQALEGADFCDQGDVSWIPKHTSPLHAVEGFASIDSLFHTKRGLRLKQSDFFLCKPELIGQVGATPFVKKIVLIQGFEVPSDHPEAALLLQSGNDNPEMLNELERRLIIARRNPFQNKSVLTWYHERHEVWFQHPPSPQAPILFNYYLRNRPRHIFNLNRAFADNFYGVTTFGDVPIHAWLAALNSTCVCVELLANARNQGNGLTKLQLFEYRRVLIPNLNLCSNAEIGALESLGQHLTAKKLQGAVDCIQRIDYLLASIFSDKRLRPNWLRDRYRQVDTQSRKPKSKRNALVELL